MAEIDIYRQRIKDLNAQVCDFVREIPADGLNWRPSFNDVNSLAALADHIAQAQRFWILDVLRKKPVKREQGMGLGTVAENGSQLGEKVSAIFHEVDGVLNDMATVDLGEILQIDEHRVPIRWGLVHIIDHTALHFGQMQLMFQFWSNGRSKPSPYWHQRIPSA